MKATELKINLNEIFFSFQGEGYHSGTPAIFIRTAGCNLSCEFCDTDFSLKFSLTPEEIYQKIKGMDCKFLVITGGEPTLQKKALTPFIKKLQALGYYISLETNGDFTDTMGVDWVTVSPKLSQKGRWNLKKGHELKLVYENQDLNFYLQSDFKHYFLQPKEHRTEAWGKGQRKFEKSQKEWVNTAKAVLDNSPWKLSLQLHKEFNVP